MIQAPLFDAIKAHDMPALRSLIAANAPVNGVTLQGRTPLQWALCCNLRQFANIHAGAQMEPSDQLMIPGLFAAANSGDAGLLKSLISIPVNGGAYVNTVNKKGNTPLDVATAQSRSAAVKLLVDAGARRSSELMLRESRPSSIEASIPPFKLQDGQPEISLSNAIKNRDRNGLLSLIATKAPIHTVKFDDKTPLQLACSLGNLEGAKMLIKAGVRVSPRDRHVKSAFFSAANDGDSELLRMLISARVDVNIVNKQGKTPLDIAIGVSHSAAAKVLVDAGGLRGFELARSATSQGLIFPAEMQHERVVNINNPQLVDNTCFLRYVTTGTRLNCDNVTSVFSRGEYIVADKTAVMHAVMADDIDGLRALIAAKAPVNARSNRGRTLLETALHKSRFRAAQVLLEAGATIDISKDDGFNACMAVIFKGDVDLLHILISAKMLDVNITNEKGVTPLLVAAHNTSPQIVQMLLDSGARFDPQAPEVKRTLCTAATRGRLDTLRFLLSQKASVDVVDKRGRSPLQIAVANRHPEIVRFLIDLRRHAELRIHDLTGAEENNEQLIAPAVIPTLPSISIFAAVATGNLPALRQLIAANADVNVTDADGQSVLQIAIRDKLTDVIALLIEAGADVASGGEMGIYPLSFAAVHGDPDAVVWLIAAGAPINQVNRFGQSALYLACQHSNISAAEMLLVAKANVDTYVP